MRPQYLLLAFGDQAQREALAADVSRTAGLEIAVVEDTFLLLSNRSLAEPPPGDPWLIGELYRDCRTVDHRESRLVGAAAPSHLLRQHWGRYVALWAGTDTVRVLRDPSGALPCYYRRENGIVFVASDLSLLRVTSSGRLTADWAVVAHILSAADLRTAATAIGGVNELAPGELLSATPRALETSTAWSPWQALTEADALPISEQAVRLRRCIESVATALGSAHPRALATVSGGLDSSIVALSLAPVTRSLACLTLATPDPAGDERRYARLAAAAAGVSYEECFLDHHHVDLGQSQAAHLPRPIGRPLTQATWQAISEVASRRGAETVFNGTGGDNVFCFLRSATPIVDRALAEGPAKALTTLRHVAWLTGASYLQVFGAALRRARSSAREFEWRRDLRFLAMSEATNLGAALSHPWLQRPPGVRPGTVAHLAQLLRIQNYLDPWGPAPTPDMINPLLAQPIVELCLSIPTWQWCDRGSDRAVARQAFSDLLPPQILARRWKGGPDSVVVKLAGANRSVMRSMLVEGLLAERGLLDRAAITAALDDPRPIGGEDALRLLALTDAEAWVRLHG